MLSRTLDEVLEPGIVIALRRLSFLRRTLLHAKPIKALLVRHFRLFSKPHQFETDAHCTTDPKLLEQFFRRS